MHINICYRIFTPFFQHNSHKSILYEIFCTLPIIFERKIIYFSLAWFILFLDEKQDGCESVFNYLKCSIKVDHRSVSHRI